MRIKKLIHRILKWEVPTALPSEMFLHKPGELTWEKWRADKKSKYPIRFFICETLPLKTSIMFSKLNNFIYWIKCHTYKKYHLLDMRQPKGSYYEYRYGYRDIVVKMIFANFNLLSEYIEKELGGIYKAEEFLKQLKTIEDVSPTQITSLEKAIELYEWWNKDLQMMHAIEEGALIALSKATDRKEITKLCDRTFEMECEIDNMINLKLKELIDIRLSLWT